MCKRIQFDDENNYEWRQDLKAQCFSDFDVYRVWLSQLNHTVRITSAKYSDILRDGYSARLFPELAVRDLRFWSLLYGAPEDHRR
jgi:hypothetical protein